MPAQQWTFDGYAFPYEDSPPPGQSDDWNLEEKLIEHDPLMANVTILTSWGFKSRRRTITGQCGLTTRDTIFAKWQAKIVGILIDGESRSITARITNAKFVTLRPVASLDDQIYTPRYEYQIEFMAR